MSGITKSSHLSYPVVATLLGLSIGVLIMAGCGKPFNVKPKPDQPAGAYRSKVETTGVTIHAEALTNEDELFDTFDANLLMAGVLAVRIKMTNTSGETAELKGAKFELRGQNGARFKLLKPDKAYGRLLKYYGVSFYNKHSNAQAKADFATHGLDLQKSFAAGEERDGLLFFQVPVETINSGNLTLLARNLRGSKQNQDIPIELKMN